MSFWAQYQGKLSAGVHRSLAHKIGEDTTNKALELGLVGGASRGPCRVAMPLWDSSGKIATAVLIDPDGKADPPVRRLPNNEVGLADGTPVWMTSVPGGLTATINAAAGRDLNLTVLPLHVLSFVGLEERRGPCIGINGAGALQALVKVLLEWPPFSRPARILHWFDWDRYPGELQSLNLGRYPLERMKSPEEVEKEAAANLAKNRDMFVMFSGKIAVLMEDGIWREASKGVATNMLVSRGYAMKAARKAVDALPVAVDYVFQPATKDRVIQTAAGTFLNEYRGMPIEPTGGTWGTIWRLIDHLVNGDPGGRDYLLDWLAAPLQAIFEGRGSRRTLSAVVLHGAQGTGKGWLTEILRVLYGEYLLVIGQQNLEDAFEPERMRRLLFLVANEITASARGDDSTLARLKAWITEDHIPLRRMHAAGDECRAHFNMLFTSNAERPVRLEWSDRRYSVWIQTRPLPADVIAGLQAQKADGWPEVRHFLAALLERKILREFWKPYDNKARAALMSIDSTTMFAEQLRDLGIQSMARDWVLEEQAKQRRAQGDGVYRPTFYTSKGGNKGFVPTKILSEIYRIWCRSYGYKEVKQAGAVVNAILETIPGSEEMTSRLEGHVCRGVLGIPLEQAPVVLSDSAAEAQRQEAVARATWGKKPEDDWFEVGARNEA